jgi:hypothetical protein
MTSVVQQSKYILAGGVVAILGLASSVFAQQAPKENPSCSPTEKRVDGVCVSKSSEEAQTGKEEGHSPLQRNPDTEQTTEEPPISKRPKKPPRDLIPTCSAGETLRDGQCTPKRE